MLVSAETLKDYLRPSESAKYGLCMFAPTLLSTIVNRKLNQAYLDTGDNLSVPLGSSQDNSTVTYWGGNYSVASVEHAFRTIDVFLDVPGSVLVVTTPGVGADHATVLGIIEHGQARTVSGQSESFFSFAKQHLGVERLEAPNNAIVIQPDIQLALATIHFGPSSTTQIFLATPWEAIFRRIMEYPNSLFEFANNPRHFEEFIAESYSRAGYKVQLTPRSGDGGVDVIAELQGHGAIKILDQTKAFSGHRSVTADDVRAAVGTLSTHLDASKVVVTTTSQFSPGVYQEFSHMTDTRLELRDGQHLISWLKAIHAHST